MGVGGGDESEEAGVGTRVGKRSGVGTGAPLRVCTGLSSGEDVGLHEGDGIVTSFAAYTGTLPGDGNGASCTDTVARGDIGPFPHPASAAFSRCQNARKLFSSCMIYGASVGFRSVIVLVIVTGSHAKDSPSARSCAVAFSPKVPNAAPMEIANAVANHSTFTPHQHLHLQQEHTHNSRPRKICTTPLLRCRRKYVASSSRFLTASASVSNNAIRTTRCSSSAGILAATVYWFITDSR